MEYKGYVGIVEYDPDDELFRGRIVNLGKDGITFAGESVKGLKKEFRTSIDDYLDWCKARGEEPEQPFSGNFLVRTTPELHRDLATAAAVEHKSVNSLAQELLRQALERRPAVAQVSKVGPVDSGRVSAAAGRSKRSRRRVKEKRGSARGPHKRSA